MQTIDWQRYPKIAANPHAQKWLTIQLNLGLADNTIAAYARGVEDYLEFCERLQIMPVEAKKEQIALYVRDLATRPNARGHNIVRLDSGAGLSNATMQQRLTAVRLFYDHLVEEQIRDSNPVGRGRYVPYKNFGGMRHKGLLPRYQKLPWIPTEEQWQIILQTVCAEPLRNRTMFAFAYDAGLRREELCSLEIGDIDPSRQMIRIRAETTKNRLERIVPYSPATSELYRAYLQHRRVLSRERGRIFLSESRRNSAQPVTIWTWSKVVKGIADRCQIPQFSTHTLRHLCLTDLARANWDIHEIASFAGHRNVQTTLQYIHLSGRDLARKFERILNSSHAMRVEAMGAMFQ